MDSLANMLSVPYTLEHEGKRYPMRKPNLLEAGRFQRWLEDRGFDAIERIPFRDDEAKRAALNAHVHDCAAGVYEWGGEIASRAILTESGMSKYVEIICDVKPEIAKELICKHIERILAVVTAASSDDPKAVGEALKSLGLPATFLSSDSGTRRSTKAKKKSRR